MKRSIFFASILFSMAAVNAQVKVPAASPSAEVSQTIGLTKVEVEYARPSAKGRKIFGDVVPFDKVWRTGANAATKIEFDGPVKIQGVEIPKGEYGLFTIPTASSWTIILNKKLVPVQQYDAKEDVARFEVKTEKTSAFTETFTIGFGAVNEKEGTMYIKWENTKVSFKIESDADAIVMESIANNKKWTSRDYFQAAMYYFNTNRDLNQALEWINKSIEDNNDRFYVNRSKSLIQAKMGDYKGAIATAEKSLKQSEEAKDDAYIKMNKESIAEWKKQVK